MLPLISGRRLSVLNAMDNDAEDISNFESVFFAILVLYNDQKI